MKTHHIISILIFSISLSFLPPGATTTLSTNYIRLTLDPSGNVTSLTNTTGNTEYIPKGQQSPLLSLYKDSAYFKPVSMLYNASKKRITLTYKNDATAVIAIAAKGDYLRLELISLTPRNGVQAIVWGPYATTIQKSIGETICVVHDSSFAVGMQALNINTIEGLPNGNDNAYGGSFIDPLPGQRLPDSLKDQVGKEVAVNVNITGDMPDYVRMYRGSAAVKKAYGSELRLFSRDRRIARMVDNGRGPQAVKPVDVDFAGSAIAFFGCPEPKVLDIIEKIEINEKLPHPILHGEWLKRSKIPGQAYLMFEGKDMNKGLEYAEACGFKLIHVGDLFKSWGHFDLQTGRYPGGAPDIKKVTDNAWQNNTALGVHTLTMFTGTNDGYVSPVPSDSLVSTGGSALSKEINEDVSEIYIDDPLYFKNLAGTHTVKIEKELINYRDVSNDQPWRLLDCKRGQYKTLKSAHKTGTSIVKLFNNDYNGFYPDINLQDAFAKRLAAVCNETGLGLMDFDGYGGESPTGEGSYGAAKFVDLWYKNLNKYVLTCGAGTFHYYWHIYSFMNWGEPWYNALRQSQVNYRIENQRYFTRNYMPHMLGWFAMGVDYRPEEIEWIQARSAAFNAGYLLRVDENIEKNGFKDELFATINEWQRARNTSAFSTEQVEKFKDPKKEFHLTKTSDGNWDLYPLSLLSGYQHKFRRVQTGEPISSHFTVTNPYKEQPVQLYISAVAIEGNKTETISNIKLDINNYQTLEVNESLKAGDKIIIDGKSAYLCDATWKKLKEIKLGALPKWAEGANEVTVKSDFSGEQSPVLKFDFKCVGLPEKVFAAK